MNSSNPDITIGKGAYGVVVKRGKFAIKKFTKWIPKDGGLDPSLVRELAVLIEKNSSNIVFGELLNPSEIKMKLYKFDLDRFIKKNNYQNRHAIVELVLSDMINAMIFLHQKNLIHRDIKPANILIESVDKMYKFDLCDFSIMGLDEISIGQASTRWYRAPEVINGDLFHSNKVDIWALGITLIEIIIGRQPFKGLTSREQLQLYNTRSIVKTIFGKELKVINVRKVINNWNGYNNEFIFDLLELMLIFDPTQRIDAEGLGLYFGINIDLKNNIKPVKLNSQSYIIPEITKNICSDKWGISINVWAKGLKYINKRAKVIFSKYLELAGEEEKKIYLIAAASIYLAIKIFGHDFTNCYEISDAKNIVMQLIICTKNRTIKKRELFLMEYMIALKVGKYMYAPIDTSTE